MSSKLLERKEIANRLKGRRKLYWKETSISRDPEVWAYSIPAVKDKSSNRKYKIHKGILNLENGSFLVCDSKLKDREALIKFVAFLLDNGCKEYRKKE